MYGLLTQHFWIIMIGLSIVNWLFRRSEVQIYIAVNPGKKRSYELLLQGYLFWMLLPWLVMGIGSTVGGVPDIWHFLRPQDGDPYVLALFTTIAFVGILGTYWLVVKNGAEQLVEHPGIIGYYAGFSYVEIRCPSLIKRFWLGSVFCWCAGTALMWNYDLVVAMIH